MRRLLLLLAMLQLLALVAVGCGDRRRDGFGENEHLRVETFTQLDPMRSDVLWVIDSSQSMEDEQAALADNFPHFIAFFFERDLSFRVAVTTTNFEDPDSDGLDGRFVGDPPWFDQDTVDLDNAFMERAIVGIDPGHRYEKGLAAAYGALADPWPETEGFVREDAHLAIVVVSDEPDHSARDFPDSDDFISWEPFSAWLNDFKGEGQVRMSDFSAVVGISPDGFEDPAGCGSEEDGGEWGPAEGAQRGDGYLEAAAATGGTYVSICEDDWSDMLARVGLIASGMMDAFGLHEIPVVETLEVEVGTIRVSAWEYREHDNSIFFTTSDSVPEPGQVVRVTYEVPELPELPEE
jgi:hypothetical protein